MAAINRSGRKKGGKIQGAAVLTSNVSQANSNIKHVSHVEEESSKAFECRRRGSSRDLICEKENKAPVKCDGIARNLGSSFWASIDDVPLNSGLGDRQLGCRGTKAVLVEIGTTPRRERCSACCNCGESAAGRWSKLSRMAW